jgi:hypothetical protein
MANTRDFKSLGVMASDAVEVTEDGVRDVGTAYRRTNLPDLVQTEGELFNEFPITENINQKLFNQSSFTDIIDRTGILGWTNLVDYSPPAVVWTNDGTPNTGDFYLCLRASGPSTSVVDPISDDQGNPVFWRILENPEQLRLDLADETPGAEGSRLVGYNKVDTNGGVDDGLTVKDALDALFKRNIALNEFQILASLNIKLRTTLAIPPLIAESDPITSFNIDLNGFVPIGFNTGNPAIDDQAQGLEVNYINPLPADYKIIVIQWVQQGTQEYQRARTTVSYLNKTVNSIEIYQTSINQTEQIPPIFWFNFICYRIAP